MDALWIHLALVSAVLHAAGYLVNEFLKIPGQQFVFWNKLLLGMIALPLMMAAGLPKDPIFYLAVAATVPIVVLTDERSWDVAARYGGGVLSRIGPIQLVFAFFLWMVVRPETLPGYIETPLLSACIVAALAGTTFFASRLRHCPVSGEALKLLLPATFGYAVTQILNKTAMDASPIHSGVYAYIVIQAFMVAAASLWVQRKRRKNGRSKTIDGFDLPSLFTRRTVLGGLLSAVISLGAMMAKNYSYALVENPAYAIAIMMTTPVFISLFYLAIRRKEKADVFSGLMVVLCVGVLAVLTA